MSRHDYLQSKNVVSKTDDDGELSFVTLIMAAARRADSSNFELLSEAFPAIVYELQQRYDAPGGYLEGEAP